MQQLVVALIAQLSAYASILGLYFTVAPPGIWRPDWHWIVIGVMGVAVLLGIGSEIRTYNRHRLRSYSSKQINRYMCRWISQPGHTVIFSRDLSWGAEPRSKSSLIDKARKGELRICLHHETALSTELRSYGAKIVLYGSSGHSPKARFTIVGHGRDGSRVAIGAQKDGRHVVYEYSAGEHPAYAIAEDLAQIIIGYESGNDAL